MKNNTETKTARREFLGSLAAGAATLGMTALSTSVGFGSIQPDPHVAADAEAWFEKVKGKRRMVFDVPEPNGMMPFAWPRVFLKTNVATGTPESDQTVVVVLRHNGIPYAMEDRLWAKYKFGEVFKIDDPKTKAPSVRNPFWKPALGDFAAPGLGNMAIGINELQDSGAMFCVCDLAMTVYSNVLAGGADPVEVKKDLVAGLLPNIQVVPAGIWAVGRAQEKKCSYVHAGK